jgi:hypothetical protein
MSIRDRIISTILRTVPNGRVTDGSLATMAIRANKRRNLASKKLTNSKLFSVCWKVVLAVFAFSPINLPWSNWKQRGVLRKREAPTSNNNNTCPAYDTDSQRNDALFSGSKSGTPDQIHHSSHNGKLIEDSEKQCRAPPTSRASPRTNNLANNPRTINSQILPSLRGVRADEGAIDEFFELMHGHVDHWPKHLTVCQFGFPQFHETLSERLLDDMKPPKHNL